MTYDSSASLSILAKSRQSANGPCTDDPQLNETMAVQDHDVAFVPRGHHPCGAPNDFEMYYLNVMAGPLRKSHFVAAPEVAHMQ